MSGSQITKWAIVGSIVAILGYDAYAAWGMEDGVTISRLMSEWQMGPFGFLIPMAMGVLAGHWFWPLKRDNEHLGEK